MQNAGQGKAVWTRTRQANNISKHIHTQHIPTASVKVIPDATVLRLLFSEVVAACAHNACKLIAVWERDELTTGPSTSTYSTTNKHVLRPHLMQVSWD